MTRNCITSATLLHRGANHVKLNSTLVACHAGTQFARPRHVVFLVQYLLIDVNATIVLLFYFLRFGGGCFQQMQSRYEPWKSISLVYDRYCMLSQPRDQPGGKIFKLNSVEMLVLQTKDVILGDLTPSKRSDTVEIVSAAMLR